MVFSMLYRNLVMRMSDSMTTWRTEISEALNEHAESWGDVIEHTLSEQELDRFFDSGYGEPEGEAFTLWTNNRVYFSHTYDGLERVYSVPRHPSGEKIRIGW